MPKKPGRNRQTIEYVRAEEYLSGTTHLMKLDRENIGRVLQF